MRIHVSVMSFKVKIRNGNVCYVIPFQAIIEGRQELPSDYYKEFLRGPYALVAGGTIAAYFAHPFMMAGAALFKW